MYIRLHADYGCYPLWFGEADGLSSVDPRAVSVSYYSALRGRMGRMERAGRQVSGDRRAAMRRLAIEAQAEPKRNAGRVPYPAHALSVGRIVDDALTRTGELAGDAAHQEDIYLAGVGHGLYEDTAVTPQQVREQFGERVDAYVEGMTRRQDDPRRAAYLARMRGAVEPVKLIRIAGLVENVTRCAYGIHELEARWIRRTFLPIVGEVIASVGKARFDKFPATGELMLQWLRFGYDRMVANLEIHAELGRGDPMEAAHAAAASGRARAREIDPEIAEKSLRRMKEQEWREALLVRGTHLFPRE